MKKKTIFICDKCSAEFSAKEDCEKHEASHKIAVGDLVYGILRKEYFIVEKMQGNMIKVNGRWRQKMFWEKIAKKETIANICSITKVLEADTGCVFRKPFVDKFGNVVFSVGFNVKAFLSDCHIKE